MRAEGGGSGLSGGGWAAGCTGVTGPPPRTRRSARMRSKGCSARSSPNVSLPALRSRPLPHRTAPPGPLSAPPHPHSLLSLLPPPPCPAVRDFKSNGFGVDVCRCMINIMDVSSCPVGGPVQGSPAPVPPLLSLVPMWPPLGPAMPSLLMGSRLWGSKGCQLFGLFPQLPLGLPWSMPPLPPESLCFPGSRMPPRLPSQISLTNPPERWLWQARAPGVPDPVEKNQEMDGNGHGEGISRGVRKGGPPEGRGLAMRTRERELLTRHTHAHTLMRGHARTLHSQDLPKRWCQTRTEPRRGAEPPARPGVHPAVTGIVGTQGMSQGREPLGSWVAAVRQPHRSSDFPRQAPRTRALPNLAVLSGHLSRM